VERGISSRESVDGSSGGSTSSLWERRRESLGEAIWSKESNLVMGWLQTYGWAVSDAHI